MNITGTMSYIKIEIEGKIVKIEGEKTIGGFIAFKNTIKNWEIPYDNEIIDENLKEEIIQKISLKSYITVVIYSFFKTSINFLKNINIKFNYIYNIINKLVKG